jgi:hypothetical protein
MKKKIIYAALLILFVIAAPSCKKTCSTCQIVKRNSSGTILDSGATIEKCGAADIAAYKLANPTVEDPVSHDVTKVECN